jgi:hypothetical protein
MDEPQNQPPIQPEIPQTPPQDSPPLNQPTDDPIARQLSAIANMIAAQQTAIEELKAKQNAPVNTTPPHDPSADAQLMFQDPRTLIREEVTNAVKPLNEFRMQMQRQNQYMALKGQIRNYFPNLAPYWSNIESQLDQAFSAGQLDPTPQALNFAVNAIVGNMVNSGMINPSAPSVKPSSPVPPNIPSSPPPPPTPPKPQLRELTEQEKTIARMNGMTAEQYLQHIEGASISVPVKPAGGNK